ncbi:MAG TPA: hypothetical protein VGO92_14560 [Acidimicrobiales bacterium]|nr:hypothetical protein [Acidimicrobiales bacterium]
MTSRNDRINGANAGTAQSPKVGEHWHAALGVYECDHFADNIKDNGRDPLGLHTHGDGIMHIHPFQKSAAGKNATIKIYADTVGMKVNATSFKLPGESKTWRDGQQCKGKAGEVQLFVNGTRRSGNPATYKPNDRDLLVLAFAPKNADFPKIPPSAPNLEKLTDVPTTTTAVPGATGDSTSTTAPGGTGSSTTASTAAPPATTATTKAP